MAKATKPTPRVAVITGGASGIGLATAERLLASGWKIAILDRDEKALAAARKKLSTDKAVRIAQLDVTDEAAVVKTLEAIDNDLGSLDGLVNSAGIAADMHVLDTPVELFRKILDVNVVGTFIVARAAARMMKAAQTNAGAPAGSIVNIASVSGLRGSKGRAAYGASKGAVVTLSQVMATELARYGIRVNAVCPGPIETPMVKQIHDAATRAAWLRHLPMRRYGSPDEIACLIEFLLDETRSGYVTGEVIAADGGFRGAGIMAED